MDGKYRDGQRLDDENNNLGQGIFHNHGDCYDSLKNINSQIEKIGKRGPCGSLNRNLNLTSNRFGDVEETNIIKKLDDKDININWKPSYNVERNIDKKPLYDDTINKKVVNLSLVELSHDTRRILGKVWDLLLVLKVFQMREFCVALRRAFEVFLWIKKRLLDRNAP